MINTLTAQPKTPGLRSRSGFALFSALLTIVLLTALTIASFFRTAESVGLAQTTTLRQHAFFAAEHALWSTLATANPAYLQTLPVAYTALNTTTTGELTTRTATTKADSSLYWITVQTTMTRGLHQASSKVGISVKMSQNINDSTFSMTPIAPYAWIDLH